MRKRDGLYNEEKICMFSGTQLFRGRAKHLVPELNQQRGRDS